MRTLNVERRTSNVEVNDDCASAAPAMGLLQNPKPVLRNSEEPDRPPNRSGPSWISPLSLLFPEKFEDASRQMCFGFWKAWLRRPMRGSAGMFSPPPVILRKPAPIHRIPSSDARDHASENSSLNCRRSRLLTCFGCSASSAEDYLRTGLGCFEKAAKRLTFNVQHSTFPLLVLIFSLGLTGCGQPKPAPARTTVPPGTATVHGTVRFVGTAPAAQPVGGNCCPGSPPVLDESILVNPNGTLKNVVVHIKDGPNLDLGPMPERVLAQKDCQYVPHAIALRSGQTVVVTNHDPTMHNVLVQADANRSDNIEEMQGAGHSLIFANPDIVRFKCSVHPWMTAYACVFDDPCFAVTGDDGSFEIGHLPPGTYTLVAWQEKLGTQQMQVTVTADKPAEVKIEYLGE